MKIFLISLVKLNPGVRILSACLKKAGHQAQIIFFPDNFQEQDYPEVSPALLELLSGADLVGISVQTMNFNLASRITREIRIKSAVPIIWGGIHCAASPQECLKETEMICVGEGETALLELAEKIRKKEEIKDIPNIWFKEKRNKLRPLVRDLDSLPFPDYADESHFALADGMFKPAKEGLSSAAFGKPGNSYYIIASRGCPFNCAYCCNSYLNKLYSKDPVFRKRSMQNIIDELILAKRQSNPPSRIVFEDDAFFLYSLEEIRLFSRLYREKINLPFRIGGATPSTLKEDKLSLLVEAGLNAIRLGLQSASKRTLRLYKREEFAAGQIQEAARIINRFRDKVIPEWDVIIDNPWENEEDLRETLLLLSRLPVPYCLRTFSLTFYPGTELCAKAQEEGLFNDEAKSKNYFFCKNTYYNLLFSLFAVRAGKGRRTPGWVIVFLTNKVVRRLKLHLPLLACLFRY